MATGISTQLTRQIGEHLVAAKLGRLKSLRLFATPFAGNVPDFDLAAANAEGKSLLVQVKAINGPTWQIGDATAFLEIEFKGNKQVIKGKKQLKLPDLVCVFVYLRPNEDDDFYVFRLQDLQSVVEKHYSSNLQSKNGVRPKNPKSTHCAIRPAELEDYKDNWSLIEQYFA